MSLKKFSEEDWKYFKKGETGGLEKKGMKKNRGKFWDPQKTMGKIIITGFVAKKIESLVKLPWETSIWFLIKTILLQPVCSTLWQYQITKILFTKVAQAQKSTGYDC